MTRRDGERQHVSTIPLHADSAIAAYESSSCRTGLFLRLLSCPCCCARRRGRQAAHPLDQYPARRHAGTPPPYIAVPAYPQLKPKKPIAAMREPGANRIVYLENYGYDELRGVLRRFEAKPDVARPRSCLN